MTKIKVSNTISGPVADCVMDTGTLVQFVGLTGGGVMMAVKPQGTDMWGPALMVENPERFGQWATVAQMKQWVQEFRERADDE